MKRFSIGLLVAALAVMVVSDIFARGGGGGGRGGGGGGARVGGGGGGGGSFSGGGGTRAGGGMSAVDRSPSMSRTAPAQRPTQPNVASRTGGSDGGFSRGPAAAGQFSQRPSANQLGSFLDMPQQSRSAAPSQRSGAESGIQSKTITTPGGSTVTVAGGKGSTTTPGGATIGGAAGGIKVEGAGGNTYVKGGGAIGGTNGAQSAVRGGSVTGVQGKNGYAAVNVRGGAAAGGVARVGSVTAVRGPGGNTVAYGRGASFVNGQFVGGNTWRAVNGNFTHWNYFTPGWYGRYPGCWWPGKWAIATTAWATATWALAGSYCGCVGEPIYYDYSENVTYDQGTVYYGDQPIASAEQYYDQAGQLADAGATPENEEWLPLGVFAVVAEGQTTSDKLLQLAVNKEGVIRGNYQDMLADKITPVIGSVDKKTQRVALRLEGNDKFVAETGLYNLTNDEVPMLIHLGPDRQENRTLIRLKQEEAQESGASKGTEF